MEHRYGRFSVTQAAIDTAPAAAMAIMGRCIILRCEHMYMMNAFEYVAYSPDFDLVEQGERIPIYYIVIHQKDREIERVEFRRTAKDSDYPMTLTI